MRDSAKPLDGRAKTQTPLISSGNLRVFQNNTAPNTAFSPSYASVALGHKVPPELLPLITAWHTMHPSLKRGILAMVLSAMGGEEDVDNVGLI